MNIVTRALSAFGFERRTYTPGLDPDPSWDGAALLRGVSMAPGTAESLSTVYACVSAIAETIASLPLILYRRTGTDDRERANDHPLYKVLHDSPNDQQTALEFRELMQAAVLLRGNAFAEIVRGWDGQVRALLPLSPDRVTVMILDNQRLAYQVSDLKGGTRRLLQEEVLHLRHRSADGLLGVAPITASRETVQLALAEREHGNATFINGARLSGLLKFPQKLKSTQREELRASWNSQYSGGKNSGKTAILEEGVDFQSVSMTSSDAQYLESRQFSVEEIARLFRVPPTIIGDLRHGNYSNSVEMNRVFVVHTLRRHLTMWEQAIAKALLTEAGRRTYFAEHSVEGLLRGDSAVRAAFYGAGIKDGWMLPEEVRTLENLPKLTDAQRNQTAQTQQANAQAGQAQGTDTGPHPGTQRGDMGQTAQAGAQ